MILSAALESGLDFDTAYHAPKSMVEDMIAARQILRGECDREFTDPDDIERELHRMFALR